MLIDVFPTAGSIITSELDGKTAVVFDILRATSTIVTAFQNGCSEVVPMVSVEEATFLGGLGQADVGRKEIDVLVAGERGGQKLEGFPYGNSPLEFTSEVVKGKKLVLTTTNGTRAISGAAQTAAEILIGSILNARAAAVEVCRKNRDATMVCAGTVERYSLEDTLAAGLVIKEIVDIKVREGVTPILTDLATMAYHLAGVYQDQPLRALYDSLHGQKLLKMGLADDLAWCARLNTIDLVPYYSDGKIVL